MKLNKMTSHYLVTALWSTCDYSDEGTFLDARFDLSDISDEFKAKAAADCDKLIELTIGLFTAAELADSEQLGHDFWLTRNRHGAGFWDGDYRNGDAITEIVHKYFPENDDELRESIEKLNDDKAS